MHDSFTKPLILQSLQMLCGVKFNTLNLNLSIGESL